MKRIYQRMRAFFILLFLTCIHYVAAAQAPTVQQFSPQSGCANTTPVVITGTNFVNVTGVMFGGTNALSFIVNSPTQITATPANGTTGPIMVMNVSGSGLSVNPFTVIALPALPTNVTATPNDLCSPDSVNLSAISAGNIINWYTVPAGGVLLGSSASGANFSTFANATTTYYAESATGAAGQPVTFNYSGSIVNYTVPPGVNSVIINARGAQGGAGGSAIPGSGGLGANLTGTFAVTPGQVLKILVGQMGGGSPNTPGAGGGGGSFVTDNSNNPLIVAGGGGARHGTIIPVGMDAVLTTNGADGYSAPAGYPNSIGIGGVNGNGATNGPIQPHSGNGGGLLTAGAIGQCGGSGQAFINGGAGGASCTANIDVGGFGGGAGSGNNGAGGGGGYSGGGGSYHTPTNGGGGGSFNSGTSPVNLVDHTGNGVITITPVGTGCVSPSRVPVTVTVNNNLGLGVTVMPGFITAIATGGTPPYQYNLNGGAYSPNNTFANLCTGIYTVTVKDNFVTTCTQDTVVSMTNLIQTSIVQSACVSYFFNGQTLTTSGVYYDTLVNAYGCDSIITLTLTINSVNVNVNQTGNMLTAVAAGATYQWINCATNTIIPGATSQSYTPAVSGNFAVIVTMNGCTDTSLCKTVVINAINEQDIQAVVHIYPNPVQDQLFIEVPAELLNRNCSIVDVSGRIVSGFELTESRTAIPFKNFSRGLYTVRIEGVSAHWKIEK